MDDLGSLVEQVRQHGCRLTRQRVAVLQALCELDGHASAEMIPRQISQRQQDVDLSTVYRTLERLQDLAILSQTDLGRGCAEYEVVAEQRHHHLICQQCSLFIDLDNAYLMPMVEAIRQDLGPRPIVDHLAIFGVCQDCLDAGQDHDQGGLSRLGFERE
jgi:Fur family ferric uptake transcriptional regulator